MIETTGNYVLVHLIEYLTWAVESSAPAVTGLLTYASTTPTPISSTTMKGIHAATHAVATS